MSTDKKTELLGINERTKILAESIGWTNIITEDSYGYLLGCPPGGKEGQLEVVNGFATDEDVALRWHKLEHNVYKDGREEVFGAAICNRTPILALWTRDKPLTPWVCHLTDTDRRNGWMTLDDYEIKVFGGDDIAPLIPPTTWLNSETEIKQKR